MDFLVQLRAKLQERIDARAAAKAELDAILASPAERGDDLTAEEQATFQEVRSRILSYDLDDPTADGYADSIAGLQARVSELAAIEARQHAISAAIPAGAVAPVQVRKEERQYGPANERRGVSFLRDVMNAQTRGDWEAQQRLSRHMQEERIERADALASLESRDVGTGAFAGLTVPQYLTEMVAPATKNMRPFADVCARHPLGSDGMTVEISRVTTASGTAVQATEGATVQETDMDDTLLSVPVRTISGQQDISRQAIDRGTGIDSIVVQDLMGEYHTTLDSQILNGAGTSGTHLGVIATVGNVAVTYTDASPTAAELYPKLADLIQQIQAATNAGLSHFVMHPRRWWWFATQLASTFPLLQINGPQQVGQVGERSYAGAGAAVLGATVVLDRNIPTDSGAGTEDPLVGVDASECHLWEDASAPLLIRAEQPGAGSLQVKFVVYGYSAFTAGRYPLATGEILGTGQAAPTF